MKKSLLGIALSLLVSLANAQTTADYKVLRKVPIGGKGGWDYLTVDSQNRRLYVAHSTQIEVLNLDTYESAGVIPNTAGAHGVAVVPALNKGYITNGQTATCLVFDLKTLKQTGEVKTDKKPDAILYEPVVKRVFAANNEGNTLTVIDPATDAVAGTVELGGAPEALVSDENGHLYVNLEDTNEIVVVDTKTLKVLNRWPLKPGEEPTGLALDRKNHWLFSVCSNPLMMVMDAKTGKILAQVPIGKGSDGVVFNPTTGQAISANGDGTMTVVTEAAGKFVVAQSVTTQRGARTIAFDPKTGHVWTATAEYGPAPAPTTENPRPRPSVVPNSFFVMEVGK